MAFSCNIVESSKELNPMERIRVRENADGIVIDKEFTDDDGSVVVPFGYYALLDIHNDMSENKDYQRLCIITSDGDMYTTGSKTAIDSFKTIYEELKDYPDDWSLKFVRRPSRNRVGQHYLNCTVAM